MSGFVCDGRWPRRCRGKAKQSVEQRGGEAVWLGGMAAAGGEAAMVSIA
jgi:hypothetical protein